jgi:hypothetical protein
MKRVLDRKGPAVDQRLGELEKAVSASAVLGHLNFSDGRPEPRWQRQLDDAFAFFDRRGDAAPWTSLLDWLGERLRQLHAGGVSAFRDVAQAEEVLLRIREVLDAYKSYHTDLLGHLSDRDLFGPFFLVRVAEAVLARRARGNGGDFVADVLVRLNDFVGHRPVAILETRPQGEPYEHERHRPMPVYLRGTGVASGPYHDIIQRALDILRQTNPSLLAEAHLDLDLLDELAIDLRAYDHGHPVNRRPNYAFGEWDPHHIDNQGRYRRYVARKVTIDALLSRLEESGPGTRDERLTEAAAVLAGTILMATGVSGAGPVAHDSATTLATLLPQIARYRDAFYEQLLSRLSGTHAARLRQEQQTTRQPFGAARQHLNAWLARHRATQMQQRYLSLLFASMGYPEAARVEARRIPAVSVRLMSEILGRLASGQVEADRGELSVAASRLPEVEDLLKRGIACGAFADPWNILGFQGLFPLSAAREDSVRDPRIDELVQVIEQIFNLYARLMSEAAASGDSGLVQSLGRDLRRLGEWWDQFATADVSDVRRVHGGEASSSANEVADALTRWRDRGEATADLTFWRRQLDRFHSPKAFALVVDTLLRKGDYRSSLALLINWVGQAEQVPLEDGHYSYHTLALRWMLALTRPEETEKVAGPMAAPLPPAAERPGLIARFFDYLEANAEEYWHPPSLEVRGDDEEEEEEDDLYGAAYEDVTYQDSTDAGEDEGSIVDGGPLEEFDLEEESERLEKRLRFLATLARLWQVAARAVPAAAATQAAASDEASWPLTVANWRAAAHTKQQRLLDLLDAIHGYPLPEPSGDYESLVEYDRRRVVREQLLYATISTCLDMSLAVGALRGACDSLGVEATDAPPTAEWEADAIRLEQALFRGDQAAARTAMRSFMDAFRGEPLLFTPLTEGGSPRAILRVRIAQTVLRALLANLPRLGLLRETYDLLRAARGMEQAQPTRGRGVTEFNHFFQAAYQAVVESVIEAAAAWPAEQGGDQPLVDLLERLTAPFLSLWIEHSRTLQLSVLETIGGDAEWRGMVGFVQRYGGELFHARFMTLANLRGILHRGVSAHLDYLQEHPDPLHPLRLLDDVGRSLRREDAVRRLETVLQAVVENYEEYKDYNTTTTQSDYGENLHVLLEFLRLKVAYERHAWQFKPLVLAHEVLARHNRGQTAVLWEESLTRFTQDLARQHLEQLARLEKGRGVRLSTISDRLHERFVKPLALDRLCARIEPAMNDARAREASRPAFERLQQELAEYTATPFGVGLDVPYWLRRLEMEVHRVQATQTTIAVLAESHFRIPRHPLSYEDVQRQLRGWERPPLPR